jgi:antitoxin (DNA-binding transcriptional repressor) of toxin-antitoxin stability system
MWRPINWAEYESAQSFPRARAHPLLRPGLGVGEGKDLAVRGELVARIVPVLKDSSGLLDLAARGIVRRVQAKRRCPLLGRRRGRGSFPGSRADPDPRDRLQRRLEFLSQARCRLT